MGTEVRPLTNFCSACWGEPTGRTRKKRGSRTHGRGRKAGRGKGLRGGRGQAGLLKHKFKWVVKNDPEHFGRRGFKRHASLRGATKAINLDALEYALVGFMEAGLAEKEGKGYRVDLRGAGYGKLMGRGAVALPLTVIVPAATRRAVEKVEAAGGKVVAELEEA